MATVNHTTLGEIVKGHRFPIIEYRTNQQNMPIKEYREILSDPDVAINSSDIIYAGLCGYEEKNGFSKLTSHDGDTYHLTDEVEAYTIDPDGTLIVWLYTTWNR